MAFTSRRLLPETLTYTPYSSSSFPPSPSPSPSTSPPPDAFTCSSPFNCAWLYPSPPPPSSSLPNPPTIHGSSPHLSAAGILAISLISFLFLLLVYFFILSRLRRRRRNISHPRQQPPPGDSNRWDEEVLNENPAFVHPIWLINTVGLQPEVIGAISVCLYRKGEGLIEGDYCSICLSEFKEGEGLRLLPKCSHAFHLPCIDTWLRSHTNCPLCRAPILSPALASGSVAVLDLVESSSSTGDDQGENGGGGDPEGHGVGDSSNAAGGVAGEEGLSDKNVMEDFGVGCGVSVGRRSVSMDARASAVANNDGESNRRGGRVGGARSLSCSGRLCLPGSDS